MQPCWLSGTVTGTLDLRPPIRRGAEHSSRCSRGATQVPCRPDTPQNYIVSASSTCFREKKANTIAAKIITKKLFTKIKFRGKYFCNYYKNSLHSARKIEKYPKNITKILVSGNYFVKNSARMVNLRKDHRNSGRVSLAEQTGVYRRRRVPGISCCLPLTAVMVL